MTFNFSLIVNKFMVTVQDLYGDTVEPRVTGSRCPRKRAVVPEYRTLIADGCGRHANDIGHNSAEHGFPRMAANRLLVAATHDITWTED